MIRTKLPHKKKVYKRTRKKQANSMLRISVKDKLGKIYKCNIPVFKMHHLPSKKIGMRKRKRESTIIIPVSADDQSWEIVNLKGRRIRPSDLKNKTIVLNKGTKKIRGTVVGVMMENGGATSPPVGGGLPPVDE